MKLLKLIQPFCVNLSSGREDITNFSLDPVNSVIKYSDIVVEEMTSPNYNTALIQSYLDQNILTLLTVPNPAPTITWTDAAYFTVQVVPVSTPIVFDPALPPPSMSLQVIITPFNGYNVESAQFTVQLPLLDPALSSANFAMTVGPVVLDAGQLTAATTSPYITDFTSYSDFPMNIEASSNSQYGTGWGLGPWQDARVVVLDMSLEEPQPVYSNAFSLPVTIPQLYNISGTVSVVHNGSQSPYQNYNYPADFSSPAGNIVEPFNSSNLHGHTSMNLMCEGTLRSVNPSGDQGLFSIQCYGTDTLVMTSTVSGLSGTATETTYLHFNGITSDQTNVIMPLVYENF